MQYKPFLTKDEAKGLSRSKNHALNILHADKYKAHNVCVNRTRKIALCQNEEILHIIPRKAYEEFITPKINFNV